jgi:hypothetical protein
MSINELRGLFRNSSTTIVGIIMVVIKKNDPHVFSQFKLFIYLEGAAYKPLHTAAIIISPRPVNIVIFILFRFVKALFIT